MAERAGVACIAIPAVDLPDFDGASFRINGRPTIVLNAERDAEAVRMTVAHELAQLSWVPAQRGAIAEMEASAYDVGWRVLFPTDAAENEMPHPVTLAALSEMKVRWGMEVKALVVRAHRLGLLSDDRYKSLMIGHRGVWPAGERTSGRFVEKPRALSKMVEELYGGDTSLLANAVGLPPGLVDGIVRSHASRVDIPRRAEAGGEIIRFPVLERLEEDEAERA
jgi:Zn-dependent peptidase ImmA (M78 family)